MGFFRAVGTLLKVTGVATFVVGKAAYGITKGAVHTLGDGARTLDCLVNKDYEGAEKIVAKRIEGTLCGVAKRVGDTFELIEEAGRCIEDKDRPFLTAKNIARMSTIATVGLVAGASVPLIDDDDDEGAGSEFADGSDGLYPAGISSLSIHNGVFDGDQDELMELVEAGQIDETEHIEASDISRSIAARDSFLSSHGFESVPEGYEVHHIIPLSEGGADSPENMVLVKNEEHDFITKEHSRFYNWHS